MTECLAIRAPAKLNLGLRVVGRRADGYHELATIFVAVDLADLLVASNGGSGGLARARGERRAGWIAGERG